MSEPGRIVAGILSPHPPHLIYASNPPQNEPRSSRAGAWNGLLDGYEKLRAELARHEFDVLVAHTPHWKTRTGHHFLGVPHFEGKSVDPIFPNLFQYNFALDIDVELSEAIHDEAAAAGLSTRMMRNPEFRVDYGTITSCHLVHPAWDKPVVAISSARTAFDYSNEAGDQEMLALGRATRRAIEASGRRALCLASNSLSHRHFTSEPEDPEDPSFEHVYNENQSAWDRHILGLMKAGETRRIFDEMPDFTEQCVAETKDGCLSWLLAAMDFPPLPATVHGYGTVIGTGNAVVSWDLDSARTEASA
ncbi:MAG: tRNA U-34 5-methylaminomethyl-2-thiouridine biosynthesis protein [Planctomycetes bacterium]|nr:tRNA U-34 5-methylaminomethyl-2-thiouridine biosynthesis protein [Planctomycetota bacterium]